MPPTYSVDTSLTIRAGGSLSEAGRRSSLFRHEFPPATRHRHLRVCTVSVRSLRCARGATLGSTCLCECHAKDQRCDVGLDQGRDDQQGAHDAAKDLRGIRKQLESYLPHGFPGLRGNDRSTRP